ncbi:hypothetical protein B0H66DRAFT_484852 [Apodospora peruviana]|uniref:Autophagy-related protein 28 n=1 Tax=Apodospora peruviana TaxID=516989 RepID=A0AAE0LZX3_9PEZI|nr:hypothetical protein B0H66DRAFT_484852 [Apodospora peruviana]
MARNSSFFPRLSFARGDAPVLPFHDATSPPIRKKPNEYDLSDLSPRPEHGLLSSELQRNRKSSFGHRSSSPTTPFSDRDSTSGSASKLRHEHVLFAGPPPPIVASRIIYRDEEDNRGSPRTPRGLETSSLVRNVNSVLFDRGSPARTRDQTQDYEPDAVWRNLHHREKRLQKELQHLLDAQSAGLVANLDRNAALSSSARSEASDAGSNTPTGTFYSDSPTRHRRQSHVRFEQPTRATPTGEVIPVRQPRHKPMGLRAVRSGLARTITLLADLKAEEDANLASALSIRKKALSQLRKLSVRREGITEELRILESDDEEPLSRELRELGEEHEGVSSEIGELEERLVGLRNRRRWLDGRIEDVRNRREAGLSGYKGALKEVEGRVSAILRRPPVKPLDIEAIAGGRRGGPPGTDESDNGSNRDGHENEQVVEQSPGGAEFLHMRPERRTVEMAREWWDGEVAILERRKDEVDKERAALEEGVEVWKGAVKLVSDFESGLKQAMKDDGQGDKGKNAALTPEEAMYAQLEKMATVTAGLEERLQIAEDKGWNLLICAVGAELEAFKEAEGILRDALQQAGFFDSSPTAAASGAGAEGAAALTAPPQKNRGIFDGTQSSRLSGSRTSFATARSRQSTLEKQSSNGSDSNTGNNSKKNNGGSTLLLDLQEEPVAAENNDRFLALEEMSDNEVPPQLVVGHDDDIEHSQDTQQSPIRGGGGASPRLSREDSSLSENEVPPEFLAEHRDDDDDE